MKKQFLLPLIAFTMMATAASAQKNPFHIGLKGGANFSKLPISSEGVTSKYATGFSAGAFTRIDISKVYVQGELLFSKKASKFNSDLLNDQKVSWSSIDVPVLVGYKLLNMDLLNVRIFGGGVYSYTISEKASLFKQIDNSFNKFDKSNIGYQVGAGIDVGKLTFDLRYEGGLSSVSKQFKSRPNSFQASVGFMIF
ncbi:porin family protein [Pedobacter caeni]|uniref:Outer membrane protein beta-barrel domain-containing protein n=1 Tax=Pedobacter caeni TaxID=288992 RepID=A0A1M5LHI7_9SPHI|nr:porin family protein [Pedobacter caeni]SHG64604.1 Outer membrane protein beta-barrel domain-containing protein [Pedobacter caeni]